MDAMSTESSQNFERTARDFLTRLGAAEELRAFVGLDPGGLLRQARTLDGQSGHRGSLHGVLFGVKDNIHVAGLPSTAGTPALENFRPRHDAPVVAQLRAAGALPAGKTNLHELAFGITSANAFFGPVRNPHAQERFAGGSSGGSAAAIAAGLIPVALGTDTGGSVRIPAALCGVVGFRPSTGRYASGGVTPISTTRDTVGVMAHSIADVARFDSVLAGTRAAEDERGARVRLGVEPYFFDGLENATEQSIQSAMERLRAAGFEIVPCTLPRVADLIASSALPIVLFEFRHAFETHLAASGLAITADDVAAQVKSPDVKGLVDLALARTPVPEADYQNALRARTELIRSYRALFQNEKLDALLMPTTPLTAREIQGSEQTVTLNGAPVATFATYIRNTEPASVAGLPSISIPAGRTAEGLPVGLMLDGLPGEDRRLLQLGEQVHALLAQR